MSAPHRLPCAPLAPPPPPQHACAQACACDAPRACVCRPPCDSGRPECVAFRYVQPPRAKSLKPPLAYCRLRQPISDETVTRLSYQPVCLSGWCPYKHGNTPDNLKAPEGTTMEVQSTTQLDFPYWGCIPPRLPIKPCPRRPSDEGCMSDITTTRECFQQPLPVCTNKVLPVPALTAPQVPMEGMTTMRAAYTMPACPIQRANFKPPSCFKACEKFEGVTVARMSYVPWPLMPKEDKPWARKGVWEPPEKPMGATSMYGASYLPPGWFLKEPCDPRCAPCCAGPSRPPRASATGVPC